MAAKVPLELLSKLPVREAMAAVLFAAKGRPGNFGRIVAFKKPGNPSGLPGFFHATIRPKLPGRPLALNTTHHALCPALAGPFLFPGFGAACAARGLALQ